jgi:uncharacterized membrane protein
LNVLAVIVTIIFFAIIVYAVQRNGGNHFEANKSYGAAMAHSIFGLLFFLLMILQVFLGFFRPHVHAPMPSAAVSSGDEQPQSTTTANKSKMRVLWEFFHRGIGLFLLAGSIYQVLSGLHLYSNRLGTTWFSGVFWTYIVFVVLVLVFIVFARSHA